MLVEKNRLTELLNHKDPRVSNAAMEALRKFFPAAEGVIPYLLKTIKTHPKGDDAVMAAVMMGYFTPTAEELTEITKLMVDLDKKKDSNSVMISEQLKSSLLSFSFPLLQSKADLFASHDVLAALFKVAQNMQEMKSKDVVEAWAGFEEFCQREYLRRKDSPSQEPDPQSDDVLAGEFMLLTLEGKGDSIKDRVLQGLNREEEENFVREEYLIRLAGSLGMSEAVPALFRILKKADPVTYSFAYCIDSLGRIGTPEVVATADAMYRADTGFGLMLADIISIIPQDYAEEVAARVMRETADIEVKTAAAGALCEMFSNKYREAVLALIRKQKYDPFIVALLDYIIPVYAYYNDTIPHFEELEKKDIDFCNKASRPTIDWDEMEENNGCDCDGECDCDDNCECDDDCECGHEHGVEDEEPVAALPSKRPTNTTSSKKKKKKKNKNKGK